NICPITFYRKDPKVSGQYIFDKMDLKSSHRYIRYVVVICPHRGAMVIRIRPGASNFSIDDGMSAVAANNNASRKSRIAGYYVHAVRSDNHIAYQVIQKG